MSQETDVIELELEILKRYRGLTSYLKCGSQIVDLVDFQQMVAPRRLITPEVESTLREWLVDSEDDLRWLAGAVKGFSNKTIPEVDEDLARAGSMFEDLTKSLPVVHTDEATAHWEYWYTPNRGQS